MFKKIILPAFAVIATLPIAFSFSAFDAKQNPSEEFIKPSEKTQPPSEYWELITPGSNPTLPANYKKYTGAIPPSCEGEEDVCVIYAPQASGGGTAVPDIAAVANLASDLSHFWNTGEPKMDSEA